jgi:hypothetical protein
MWEGECPRDLGVKDWRGFLTAGTFIPPRIMMRAKNGGEAWGRTRTGRDFDGWQKRRRGKQE